MDRSVPMIPLVMRAQPLREPDGFALPPEYGWRFFRPGDEHAWARIETSAGEFADHAAALAGFRRSYPGEGPLSERMLFLTDGETPFATATAWYGEDGHDRAEGRLHWVAIDAEHQGKRLSYPLVALAVRRMAALGHRTAYLTTQTVSWPAIKVYRAFGFAPLIREASELEGWRIVSEKTGIDFLSAADGVRP